MKVLFENEDIVIIDKPVGLMVHGNGKTSEGTVADWFVEHYPEAKEVGESMQDDKGNEIKRPGIVHRLDKETSGVLILVKNQEAFEYIKGKFQNREVSKTYHAFVYGVIKEENGEIDRSIGRSAKDYRLRSAQRGARGALREAHTKFEVISRGEEHSFVELQPTTGRTHQLRVHLKAINYPIVCDKLYAPKRECDLGFSRLALHASKISLTLRDGEEIEVSAPLPDEFEEAKRAL